MPEEKTCSVLADERGSWPRCARGFGPRAARRHEGQWLEDHVGSPVPAGRLLSVVPLARGIEREPAGVPQ